MSESGEKDNPQFQLGVVTGNLNSLKEQFTSHLVATDARFKRLEDQIKDGFRQSQIDREEGNRILVNMIEVNNESLKKVQEGLAKQGGAYAMLDKIINFAIVLLAAAIGAGFMIHQH